MNIVNKKLNLSSFSNSKQVELEKAYTEGVYCDSPANRKLGRVGMTYAAYAAKLKGGNKVNLKKEISLTKDNFKDFLKNNEVKVRGLQRENGSYDIVGKVTKINYDDSPQNSKPYEISVKWYGNGKTEKEFFENISDLNKWINKDKIEIIPKGNSKKEKQNNIDKILAKSDDLGRAKGKRLDAIISYAEFDNVPKNATDEEKRRIIAENYIKSAELSGTPEEIANDLDEIIEDAIADYVPPKKKDDTEERKKLSYIEARTVLNYSDTLANATTRQLNNVIDYSGFDIDKKLSDDEKREKLAQKYYASADLYELTSAKEVADALDGIIEDALEDYVPPKK